MLGSWFYLRVDWFDTSCKLINNDNCVPMCVPCMDIPHVAIPCVQSRMAIPHVESHMAIPRVACGYPCVVLCEMCMLRATRKHGPHKHVMGCMVVPRVEKWNCKWTVPYILLHTAQAVAQNEQNQESVYIRILFDSGTSNNVCHWSLRVKLNLKPIRQERLQLNTFGDRNFSTHCIINHVCLWKPGSSYSIAISALCFPVICSSLPSFINLTNFPLLVGLELADQFNESRDAIVMLLGLHFYWIIVMGTQTWYTWTCCHQQ